MLTRPSFTLPVPAVLLVLAAVSPVLAEVQGMRPGSQSANRPVSTPTPCRRVKGLYPG